MNNSVLTEKDKKKKEAKRLYDIEYNKNRRKLLPFKIKLSEEEKILKKKEYMIAYRIKNKEKLKKDNRERSKERYKNNKNEILKNKKNIGRRIQIKLKFI